VKIQLLIAAEESDYSEFLSNVLSTKFSDTFAVGICSSKEKLDDILSAKRYDVVLGESEWMSSFDSKSVKLILALWSEQSSEILSESIGKVRKYQRISSIVSDILEHYATVAPGLGNLGAGKGRIVAVWSPAGGVGKTSVALAYATRKVSQGMSVTYLDLEHFSGTDAFFAGEGKSISALFEKLSSNAELLVKSVRQRDAGSGIDYFMPPTNYDDINELTIDDIDLLSDVCARDCDFLVIDLPSLCDKRTKSVLDLANLILVVSDGTKTSQAKLNIFCSQHNVFEDNKHKMRLVNNKAGGGTDTRFEATITLPKVQTDDPVSIYKTLSGNNGLDQ